MSTMDKSKQEASDNVSGNLEIMTRCYFCGEAVRGYTEACYKHWQELKHEFAQLKREYHLHEIQGYGRFINIPSLRR